MSCWRMLMVANEFNELQTIRITYPPFTLIMMVRTGRVVRTAAVVSGWGLIENQHPLLPAPACTSARNRLSINELPSTCFVIKMKQLIPVSSCYAAQSAHSHRLLCRPFSAQVMILEGANVIAAGDVTPDAGDYKSYKGVTSSIILRFGVEAAFFLVLFLGQVSILSNCRE